MEYFTHLPEFHIIICKKCQFAILPSYIHAHFRAEDRHGLDKDERQRIINVVVEVDKLIKNNKALRECKFLFLLSTSKPIVALGKLRKDGV